MPANTPSKLALQLVDAQAAQLPQPLPHDPLALAWALKEVCFQAWSTAPARTHHCARLLHQLQATQGQAEIQAVAHWVQGIADLCHGHTVAAVANLDAAHDAFISLHQPWHAAQTRVPQIMALSLLGRHAQAMQCGQDALRHFLALGDELAAGKIELNMGTLASRQDRHAEAATLFRSAAVRAARARDRSLSIHADLALAIALTWQYDFDEALRINHRARMRAETHGLAVLAAMAHIAIGRIELHRGRHHGALRELAAVCQGLAQAGASPQLAIEAETALADAYSAVNLLPEAVALYDQVQARAVDIGAPVEQARATLDGARARMRMGHTRRALQGLAQARELFQAQGNEASVAWADLSLAAAQLQQGQPTEALHSALLASSALAASGIVGWQLEAEATAAGAEAALGQPALAAARFRRTLVQAQAQGLQGVLLACHRGLGQLAASLGEPAQARQHLGQALALIDQARLALQGDAFRTAIGAQAESVHDLLVALALRDGDSAGQLLALLEQGRARALALGLQGAGPGEAEPDDPATAQLHLRLQWARDQWHQALAEGDAPEPMARRVAALEQALLEAHRRGQLARPAAKASASASASASATPFTFTPEALQAALDDHTALVAFHRLGGQLLACVATRTSVQQVLQNVQGLDERLEGLRFQIDGQRFAGSGLRPHAAQLHARVQAHLQALYQRVWAGVAPLLRGCTHVVVVPHRNLHYLPFGALHDGQAWLVERHEISLAPSATLWLAGQRKPLQAPQRVLAVGHGGHGLPQVQAEVQAVAAAFGAGGQVISGPAATQAALRAALPGVDVLHLACHGQFRADSPSFSSLELADGAFTLLDAQRLPVSGMLIALSACETGLSQVAPGDELLGLVRGFLLAGAPTVLASLWKVDDSATAQLMQGFYRRLAAGMRPAAALRNAQLDMARNGLHPFHWAAFSLHGQG